MGTYETAWVLGLGASGEAAARLLLAEGTDVQILDQNDTELLRQKSKRLKALGACVQLGHSELPPGNVSVCIVSPGVPSDSFLFQAVEARGIPMISELELGWSRANSRVLAVTGSNGKSTLVKLCADSLEHAGLKVAIAGNYEFGGAVSGCCDSSGVSSSVDEFSGPRKEIEGEHLPGPTQAKLEASPRREPKANAGPGEQGMPVPVSRVVEEQKALDWLVLEVSSFQLETVKLFRPDVGVLLNLFSNHLDRHGDLATYQQLKSRLFSRMTEVDTGIIHEDMMTEIVSLAESKNQWISFGLSPRSSFFFREGAVHCNAGGSPVSLAGTIFENATLGLTGAAAVAAMSACGVSQYHVESVAREFKPLPHRMQDIGTWDGVRFINDSKATNLAAMNAALTNVSKPVRLIAGGLSKHEPYESAKPLLAEKVTAVYLIGKAARAMAAAWQDVVPCVMSLDLEHAVLSACEQALTGDTILFSPACASFDEFRDFNDRGNCFVKCVKLLKRQKKTFDMKEKISDI